MNTSATPAMLLAALLTDEPCEFQGVPETPALKRMCSALKYLGVEVRLGATPDCLRVHAVEVVRRVPYDVFCMTHGCLIGALLPRFHECHVYVPGSDTIGERPLDIPVNGFRQLGVEAKTEHGHFRAQCTQLRGGDVLLDAGCHRRKSSTINLLFLAALADGRTVITGADTGECVVQLAGLLNAMGAPISGAGTPVIRVAGVPRLHGIICRL
jgi:UDP-N-acetylglucosamine 1-carboxyvinyltransferase